MIRRAGSEAERLVKGRIWYYCYIILLLYTQCVFTICQKDPDGMSNSTQPAQTARSWVL